ncbi:MAG: outer membrane protein assembly factor BamD [Ignavibacteriae bacterium HGW-Ignavibacteriae-1]|jgi:outer membrane protein assembly factor BamD|nr:MAG: outer membrane protein assembly factor BamD [Ignavibacteriae bacterium HGW-Ignavibacteriae-1]
MKFWKMNKIKYLISLTTLILVVACGSNKPPESGTAEELYSRAMELFDDEDYLDAASHFEIIKLQYPASLYADDAQFHIAEINYRRKEYIMAAFNFSLLRRIYPGSPHVKDALMKNAMCFYELSPPYDRDQDYTMKAIESFQEFQYLYPEDSLYTEATNKIIELRNKLAYREYFTAQLYTKMDSPLSAMIYYETVINKFSDTEYFEPAFFGKIEMLVWMKRNEEAASMIGAYRKTFPNGPNINNLPNITVSSK